MFCQYINGLTPQSTSLWFIWFVASMMLPVRVTASGSSDIELGCPVLTVVQRKQQSSICNADKFKWTDATWKEEKYLGS